MPYTTRIGAYRCRRISIYRYPSAGLLALVCFCAQGQAVAPPPDSAAAAVGRRAQVQATHTYLTVGSYPLPLDGINDVLTATQRATLPATALTVGLGGRTLLTGGWTGGSELRASFREAVADSQWQLNTQQWQAELYVGYAPVRAEAYRVTVQLGAGVAWAQARFTTTRPDTTLSLGGALAGTLGDEIRLRSPLTWLVHPAVAVEASTAVGRRKDRTVRLQLSVGYLYSAAFTWRTEGLLSPAPEGNLSGLTVQAALGLDARRRP